MSFEPSPTKRVSRRVSLTGGGDRLDRVIAQALPEVSRRAARGLISEGAVFVDGRRCRVASRAIPVGTPIVVHLPIATTGTLASPPLPVLYEDERIVVIDKPPGVHVHMTESSVDRSIVEQWPEPVFPVHRLDRGTSGVLLLAKDRALATQLMEAFRARQVEKRYVAVVEGQLSDRTIDAPIGRDPRRPRLYSVRADGRRAVTTVRTSATIENLSVVAVDLCTGRTHQIRVHLSSVGTPILGDRAYGGRSHVRIGESIMELKRPALHAARLRIGLPDGERTFVAPIPADLRALDPAGLALETAYA
ncbi:MAG: RluA family pseudouridine synthase [Deltaproteobacteria bacterium]|nr:RluA family pseudouridine synthase [Deltaproteobacteria bacterium]